MKNIKKTEKTIFKFEFFFFSLNMIKSVSKTLTFVCNNPIKILKN